MTAKKVSLLHVSDVHFGCSDDAGTQERVLESLQEALESEGRDVHVVVFTGDLTQRSAEHEYIQAQDWLFRLSEAAQAPCIVIPGNHDVDRTRADSKVLRSAYHDAASYKRWQGDIFKSHSHAQPFLSWFSDAKSDHSFLLNDWGTNPAIDIVNAAFGGVSCMFICVNTALLSCDDEDKGKLCIDLKSLNAALRSRASQKNLVILLGHHPTGELTPWNRQEFETILGQETGPHLFLHGHLHEQAGRSDYSINGQGVVTIAAGAAYPGAKYRKFFSIIDVDIKAKEVKPFVFQFSDEVGRWLPQPAQSRPIPARLPTVDGCAAYASETPDPAAVVTEIWTKHWKNPFADVVANGLPPDAVHGLFVGQTGSLISLKNHVDTIVEGQRGTGKTMLLRYFSVEVQCSMIAATADTKSNVIQHFRNKQLPVGIYCCLTNAGVNRSDFEVLKNHARQRVLFEHITALFVLCRIIVAIRALAQQSTELLLSATDFNYLCKVLRVSPLDASLSESDRLRALVDEVELQRIAANQHLSSLLPGGSPTSFNPWIDLPSTLFSILERLKEALKLTAPIFLLLDDFDQFTREQQEILFNAAAARRHDVVCYKFGIMSEGQKAFMSSGDRTYREGDDYNFVRLDWGDDSLNQYTRTVDEIVARRLQRWEWPLHITLASLLDNWTQGSDYRGEAKKIAEAELADLPEESRNAKFKEIWKTQGNARYFKHLAQSGVFHRYAGKMTIIHLSSGIFRQFLELCSAIVEAALTDPRWSPESSEKIGVEKQNKAVREWSRDMYRHLGTSGDVSALNHRNQVVHSQHLINLAQSLSKFFQAKLIAGGQNADAITISITGFLAPESFAKALLDVAVRESVLQRKVVDYTAKSGTGERFPTYRLNRRLAPSVGLSVKEREPQGRHELSAEMIELAAKNRDAFLMSTVGMHDAQTPLDL